MEYWKKIRNAVGSDRIILSGVACAVVREEKILLVRHGDFDMWQIPGGFQELGESVEQTATREIREELGVELRPEKLISVMSSPKWNIAYPNGDKIQQLIFLFLMTGEFDEDVIVMQKSEISDWGFFHLDSIPENTLDCCKAKIEDLKNFNGTTLFR